MLAAAIACSVVGLAAGPLLLWATRGRVQPRAALDGLTLGFVPALLALRVVPHLAHTFGPLALALVAAGLGLMAFADRHHHGAGGRIGRAIVLPALLVHAVTDGVALGLATSGDLGLEALEGLDAHDHGHDHGEHGHEDDHAGDHVGGGAMLLAAVVAHRLPEGLFLAALFGKQFGAKGMIWRLAALAATTALSAVFARSVAIVMPHALLEGIVAVGVGAMLWLVLHTHDESVRGPRVRLFAGFAFVVSLAVVLAIPDPETVLARAQPRELTILESFGPLFVETAPALLVGLVASGLLAAFGSRSGISRPFRELEGPRALSASLASGAAPAAALATLVGARLVDVGGWAMAARLLGLRITAARAVVTLAAVGLVALLVARVAKTRAEPVAKHAHGHAHEHAPRWRVAAREALGASLDHVAPSYLLGLALASVIEAFVAPGTFARLAPGAQVGVAIAFAAVLARLAFVVSPYTALPIAAVLMHKGAHAGAVLALVVMLPAAGSLALASVRSRLGAARATVFVTALAAAGALAAAVGLAIDPAQVPEVHGLVAHAHVAPEWIASAVAAALLLASLVRSGPRAFFGPLAPGDEHEHEHEHASPSTPAPSPLPQPPLLSRRGGSEGLVK